jgi:predicted NUDIX family NTP pyrophosphohydrolase
LGSGTESAGLVLYRRRGNEVEVFLVHPGGPFFARKDRGVWSIPKGERQPGEDALAVARREFAEETGRPLDSCATGSEFLPLGSVRQPGGKLVHAWAIEGDWPEGAPLSSNTVTLEWPPRSGRTVEVPEVDRGEFFTMEKAREKIHPSQAAFLDRLLERLRETGRG